MSAAMPTSVVVATVVNTKMSEAAFRQYVVEQLQNNERSLLNKLTDADAEADVFTTVLNVEEFLTYLVRRFPHAVDAALSTEAARTRALPEERREAAVATHVLSEGEYMDQVVSQLESGEREPLIRMSDEEWQEADDEAIGDHFSRYPFLY